MAKGKKWTTSFLPDLSFCQTLSRKAIGNFIKTAMVELWFNSSPSLTGLLVAYLPNNQQLQSKLRTKKIKKETECMNSNLLTASLPCTAAKWASSCMALKLFWLIASLSNIASDKTTDVAPLLIYSPIESV